MNELSKNYEPKSVEEKWYRHWTDKGYFKSIPDERKPYTVVIPPPNVTGVLHMGHTLNETVQDVLVRKARMSGFNACWVPGSDHASIATEAKVVQMLEQEKNITKQQLTRESFLKYAFEWKEKYGGIIYNQIRKLGCSVDWERVTFTMDDHYYQGVIKVFIDLYHKGLIYRGARMINWDPSAKTALSDEEVEHREVSSKLYYISYSVVDSDKKDVVVIATQRPETIMGDTAVCVHPGDPRYSHLKGKKVVVPLVNREVPVIFDEYVDPEFGTGVLKITPAHDVNDYNLGLKHHLPLIDTLNDDGTMSGAAQIFVGMDRFEARKQVIAALESAGQITKVEEYQTRLGYSQRTNAVVEPKISTQWFVKMNGLAGKALQAVVNGSVKIHPEEKFLATYKYWLENIKDWCISRQLWWGQRIPAWYDLDGKLVVAENEQEAKKIYREQYSSDPIEWKQDEDVLDTWFSSWLWPIEVFHGITKPNNPDISYYYPGSVLVTGQDIIFFWVARMIMAGEEYRQEKPFSDVYFTGMVRDKQGRKMSKQLGNSPDLLQLIDRFGADAVRFGILISAPAGNDLLFDESALEQGRNFNNKIWNALKLVKLWEGRQSTQGGQTSSGEFALEWFQNRLNQVKEEVEDLYRQFRLSEALKTIYSLIWDDFCSWYLEWIKPAFEQPIESVVYEKTIEFFTELLHLLHPFMPFITEEIFHLLKIRHEDLTVKQLQVAGVQDNLLLAQGELLKQTISALRDARTRNHIKPKDPVRVHLITSDQNNYTAIENILCKQLNTQSLEYTLTSIPNSIALVVGRDQFFMESSVRVDTTSQIEQLEKELEYQKGFLISVEKKLMNDRFVQQAKPEVVEAERRKKTDAEQKIKSIQESLASISK